MASPAPTCRPAPVDGPGSPACQPQHTLPSGSPRGKSRLCTLMHNGKGALNRRCAEHEGIGCAGCLSSQLVDRAVILTVVGNEDVDTLLPRDLAGARARFDIG